VLLSLAVGVSIRRQQVSDNAGRQERKDVIAPWKNKKRKK
jgi:hypothetical protein